MVKMAFGNNPASPQLQRKAWLKIRSKGRLSFILFRGVLCWGGTMFLIFACMNIFALRRTDHLDQLPRLLALDAAIWFVAGFGWGAWVWRRLEMRFGSETTQLPHVSSS